MSGTRALSTLTGAPTRAGFAGLYPGLPGVPMAGRPGYGRDQTLNSPAYAAIIVFAWPTIVVTVLSAIEPLF